MPQNKEVFRVITDAVTKRVKEEFGPPSREGNKDLPAQLAVATMQLSLRYFAETKAPKAVVIDFFLSLMGVSGEKATIKDDGKGHLSIVPPEKTLILADSRTEEKK